MFASGSIVKMNRHSGLFTAYRCGFIIYCLLYLMLVLWFGLIDVYHTHFFSGSRWLYLGYNIFRIIYLFYLSFILFFIGRTLLRLLERRGVVINLKLVDEFVLCFFSGGSILALFMFSIGYCNLFYRSCAILITSPLVILSYADVMNFSSKVWRESISKWIGDTNVIRASLRWAALVCVMFLAILLLIVKGLPPGGGGDYYTHYYPYFKHVVESHSLWPNDVWYHYYVSKGASLAFLSILITDLQAPELLTYLFFIVSALALFSIVKKYANNIFVPLAAAAAYIAAFINTNDPAPIAEWGLFQKHHEFTASLIASVVWALVHFKCAEGRSCLLWTVCTSLFVTHAVLFAPTVFPLLAISLFLMIIGAYVSRQMVMARSFIIIGSVATLVLGSLLSSNYLLTGLSEVTPFRTHWRLANQAKFSEWWSPYLMVLLEEGSGSTMGEIHIVEPANMTRYGFIKQLIRVHTAYYFVPQWLFPRYVYYIIICIAIAVILLIGRRVPFSFWRLCVPVGGTLLAAIVLSQFVTQPVSAYRFYSFTIFFIITGCVCTWCILFRLLPNRHFIGFTSYLMPAALVAYITLHTYRSVPLTEYQHCRNFALGRSSLGEAFAYRNAIFPPAVAIRTVVGHDTRVYTFNLNNYCTAPGCELESFVSFALHRDWHEIMFESPERARELLKKQGLNYFLIDFNKEVLDIIHYSPLFSADNIFDYLGVAWQEGDVYLLTWIGQGTEQLPIDFLCQYNEDYYEKPFKCRSLYQRVKLIYEMNKDYHYPIHRDPSLLPLKDVWQ